MLPPKKKLSGLFQKVALVSTLALAPSCIVTSKMPLTPGEKALVHGIFGDEVNTSKVVKNKNHGKWFGKAAFTPSKKTIYFNDSDNWSKDFSQEENVRKFGNFVHEMTHVWQYEQHGKMHVWFGAFNTNYDYKLKATRNFDHYSVEQQASIIEDYARRFLHPVGTPSRIEATPETDPLLAKVVEEKFPQARRTRMIFAAQEKVKTVPFSAISGP